MKGYKAFNKGLINNCGLKMEIGKTYEATGEIKYGTHGNGYHFAKNIEDTLRYFNGMTEDIDITEVTATGDIVESFDEYYEYFDLYSARKIRIDRIIPRKEIIKTFLEIKDPHRVIRFIQGYKLSEEEIELFKIIYYNQREVLNAIAYYQENDKDVYKRNSEKVYKKK